VRSLIQPLYPAKTLQPHRYGALTLASLGNQHADTMASAETCSDGLGPVMGRATQALGRAGRGALSSEGPARRLRLEGGVSRGALLKR
jgi:hypothetical protein